MDQDEGSSDFVLSKRSFGKSGILKNFLFLGWKDSNLRMAGPKPAALPLGHTPLCLVSILEKVTRNVNIKSFLFEFSS
jgi:hypothetical protein